jgi:hypothetical protein
MSEKACALCRADRPGPQEPLDARNLSGRADGENLPGFGCCDNRSRRARRAARAGGELRAELAKLSLPHPRPAVARARPGPLGIDNLTLASGAFRWRYASPKTPHAYAP